MSFAMPCPSCGESVHVEDRHRGWTVRCPTCAAEFAAGTARAEPPPARRVRDDDDAFGGGAGAGRPPAAQVAAPGLVLEVVAWLLLSGCLVGLAACVFALSDLPAGANPNNPGNGANPPDEVVLVILSVLFGAGVPYCGLMAHGARHMRRLTNHGWATAAGVMAVAGAFSGCGWFVAPVGVWALVVLSRPDVKAAFDLPDAPPDDDDD